MAFDYKKEYKEFYLPPKKPMILTVPRIQYIAVDGKGDPNDPEGAYKKAISQLYVIAFTIKMSYRGQHQIEGYFPYVVPPLEGLWRQNGNDRIDYTKKEAFEWTSMIRLPEFVTKAELEWAIQEATEKKQQDFSGVRYFAYEEGVCVQCMHIGSYDSEMGTLQRMHDFIEEQGYIEDFSQGRRHHEIYLSDPRRTAADRLRTVIRQPIIAK
ncbi:MAG: transcriptional regulator [Lachnospiraceae bacterium]|nr:transcriptional regulator [Lachnospiraceae bacterium]